MPKPKPNQIIRHELALTRNLQESIDSVAMSRTVNNLLTPVLVGGGVAAIGLASYAFYKGAKEFMNWGEDWVDNLTGYFSLKDAADIVSKTEGISKEEAAQKYSKEELENMAKQLRDAKGKQSRSPIGSFFRNIF
tara:strand:- start:111 stop:515 length:405 start_codon:yes stop_codon:yes gene_type:complete